MKTMTIYEILVTALCSIDELHELDRTVPGKYWFCGRGKEDTLDIFHRTIPIKVLDDFDITIRARRAVVYVPGAICRLCYARKERYFNEPRWAFDDQKEVSDD